MLVSTRFLQCWDQDLKLEEEGKGERKGAESEV